MTWTFNKDYRDFDQVAQFETAYLARYEELRAAGRYPYNDDFRGHIPGTEGPSEDSAIYMLQTLRSLREHEAKLAEYRAAGWRDFDPAEIEAGPVRYAGVAEHGMYHPDSHGAGLAVDSYGWKEWANARVARYHRSLMVLPGRNRTRGYLISFRLMVKD